MHLALVSLYVLCLCLFMFRNLGNPTAYGKGEQQPLNTNEELAGTAKPPDPPCLSRFIYIENYSVGGMDDFT